MRICSRCQISKQLSSFWRDSKGKDGFSYVCAECRLIDKRKYRTKNPDWWIKHQYGLSQDDFDRILEKQNGRCGLCSSTNGPWAVDHDHSCCPHKSKTCGKCTRGILCKNCNMRLGYLEKNWDLESLTTYLSRC